MKQLQQCIPTSCSEIITQTIDTKFTSFCLRFEKRIPVRSRLFTKNGSSLLIQPRDNYTTWSAIPIQEWTMCGVRTFSILTIAQ